MQKLITTFLILLCEISLYAQKPTRLEFLRVCDSLELQHGEVIWAQARLESGNFKCGAYKTKKNCLGIYDSKRKTYATFSSWQACVEAYRDKVQKKRGNIEESDEEYLLWLISMGYAADTAYAEKIRKIMNSEKKKK